MLNLENILKSFVYKRRLFEAGTFGPKFLFWTMIPEYSISYKASKALKFNNQKIAIQNFSQKLWSKYINILERLFKGYSLKIFKIFMSPLIKLNQRRASN